MTCTAKAGWGLASLSLIIGAGLASAQEEAPLEVNETILVQPVDTQEASATAGAVSTLPLGTTPDAVVLDLVLLYGSSNFGQRVLKERDEALIWFVEENERYVATLQEEESWLNELRKSGVASDLEFEILSTVFDEKVKARRERQDMIAPLLLGWVEQNRGEFNRFVERSLPEIARRERLGIVLNVAASLFHQQFLDITGLVLEEVNGNLGDGTKSLNYEPPNQYVLRNLPSI